MAHETAAIVSTGDELVLGQALDTNSRWLSQRLLAAGVRPVEHVTVGDDAVALAAALARLAESADVLVVTGGLGPTADDLTRAALAEILGETLVEDPAALEQVRGYFTRSARAMPELSRVQAQRPPSAVTLPNAVGTAPGLMARPPRRSGCGPHGLCFCLPGPPAEMKPMFDREVLPRLIPRADRVVRTLALHCVGIGEADIAARLGPLMDRAGSLLVGTTASGGIVSCRVRGEGSPGEVSLAVAESERVIREALGPFIFGADDESLPASILSILSERAETLSTVESCTGGLLAQIITDVPGSSAAFRGGIVSYSNDLKSSLAGVPRSLLAAHGAVSRECALALAAGGLAATGADHTLAITGVAGPGGGSPEKPVGTVWIAAASRSGPPEEARRFLFTGDREAVRRWSAVSALAMLRVRALGLDVPRLLRQAADGGPVGR